jgi:IclR family pca regulon transcriptional regulator
MEGHSSPAEVPRDPTEQPDFVTALARGLGVIRAFSADTPNMTLAQIARRVGLPRATVRRSLITLATLGYAESDGRAYSLTPKVLTLGTSYLSSSPLPRAAQPLLERLAETTRESCWLAILDGDEVLMVASARKNRILSSGLTLGSRLPAYCTALGRALLAGLPDERLDAYLCKLRPRAFTSRTTVNPEAIRQSILEVRNSGYSAVDGGVELGLRSLAVPVANQRGRTVAAMTVTAASSRMRESEMVERFLPLLRHAAHDLKAVLV